MSFDQNHKRHRDLRTQGWKYCLFDIQRSSPPREYDSGHREAFRRKGDRCKRLVSPEDIVRLGIPICNRHEALYREAVLADAEQRQRLRDKYDPGPLPLQERIQ